VSKPEAEKVSAAGSARARAEREVELDAVTEQPIEQVVEVAGTLAPDEQVVVASKVAGRVATLSFDLASAVKKGQTLATLEPADFVLRVEQAESARTQALAELGLPASGASGKVDPETTAVVREARATLQEAEANAIRTRALAEEGLATGVQRDAAEAALVRAQTAVQAALEQVRIREAAVGQRRTELGLARQQLADTGIRSPLDGVVQRRFVNVGEYLTVGAPVAEIVRVDPLRLRVSVPEREAAALRVGLQVEVRVEGGGTTHSGTLSRVAPALDLESRTLLVEADLPNKGELRPGSFAHARIVVATKRAPTVAKSAIVTFAGLNKVLTVDRGKAVERRITLGKSVGDRVEVVSGLKSGESVVIRPGSLQQGERVRVRRAAPPK
jgi:RND family efflux transporter MFP subunit